MIRIDLTEYECINRYFPLDRSLKDNIYKEIVEKYNLDDSLEELILYSENKFQWLERRFFDIVLTNRFINYPSIREFKKNTHVDFACKNSINEYKAFLKDATYKRKKTDNSTKKSEVNYNG